MKKIGSVMIIDDNESDHIIAETAVAEYDPDITIYRAYDGEEALKLLKSIEGHPDIIFLDINMPGMDGHEFLEVYQTQAYQSSVVAMLSTSDQERDKERCMAYQFVREYIVKPLEADDIRRIEEHMNANINVR